MAGLNKEQLEAVNTNHSRILCLAGAGTGKTYSMISRISRIVDEGESPSSILVLTFTNAAAFEMKERYKKLHPGKAIPEFRTFHGFCYSLIATDKTIRYALGYKSVPTIADDGATKRIQETARQQCSFKVPVKKLRDKSSLSQKEKFEYDVYLKAVDRIMQSEGVITFDKLCYGVCNLFVADCKCIQQYKERYKYIFVDEFQDTDKRQYDFVCSFNQANLFVVGDALQAIYSFRGADSSIIKQLANDPEWLNIKLHRNYRSTESICEYANGMSDYADSTYRIEIQSDKDGPDVADVDGSVTTFNQPVDIEHLTDVINNLSKFDGTSAILCRSNAEIEYICEVLKERGVEYRTSKRDVDAIHILRSVLSDVYALDWLATFLNADKYAEYIRLSNTCEHPYSIADFLNDFGNIRAVDMRSRKIVNVRNILIEGMQKKRGSVMAICADILAEIGCSHILVDDSPKTVGEAIEHLIELITYDSTSDLYVGTIHSSKGLEYDTVYLMGVGDNSFKLNSEENKNLFYVGITRAKTNLFVYRR